MTRRSRKFDLMSTGRSTKRSHAKDVLCFLTAFSDFWFVPLTCCVRSVRTRFFFVQCTTAPIENVMSSNHAGITRFLPQNFTFSLCEGESCGDWSSELSGLVLCLAMGPRRPGLAVLSCCVSGVGTIHPKQTCQIPERCALLLGGIERERERER